MAPIALAPPHTPTIPQIRHCSDGCSPCLSLWTPSANVQGLLNPCACWHSALRHLFRSGAGHLVTQASLGPGLLTAPSAVALQQLALAEHRELGYALRCSRLVSRERCRIQALPAAKEIIPGCLPHQRRACQRTACLQVRTVKLWSVLIHTLGVLIHTKISIVHVLHGPGDVNET